jgi:tetratricopeptide (TPR) repeat protein
MPFDRVGTLRTAEKLIRQGKLAEAIVEYRKVLDDQPNDWNTVNTLGDLYFRAGLRDKAVAEYGRVADHFAKEGFFSKAVALYRKILKIKPDDEHAMWQLGGIAARQGLLVDARANFTTLAERRRARGDKNGEAEVRVKLGDLDGADLATRLAAARARVTLGDSGSAVLFLKQVAADLQEKGKDDDALQLLSEAARYGGEDVELYEMLLQAYVARGDFESARQYATSAVELRDIAYELMRQGREAEGLAVLAGAAEAYPSDNALRSELVKRLIASGDMASARAVLTPEVAGDDPELLWTLAEMELRDGRIFEGTTLLQQILSVHPSKRDALVILGCSVAEVNPDAGFECIEVAARAAIAADEWGSAAAALNEFVNRVPNHIPALMRLVEICVDGGLEATMYSAQAQLADAYLVIGAGAEARVIAEDLVAREPWERANIERFRQALTLLGEADVDTIIAERLSGQTPFTSTDFLWPAEPAGTEIAPMPISTEPRVVAKEAAPAPPAPAPPKPQSSQHAIDLSSIIGPDTNVESTLAKPDAQPHSHEIDLNDFIGEMKREIAAPAPTAKLENVLQGLREATTHDSSPETAEQHLKLSATYIEMGMPDDAIKALEVTARSPRHRFKAGALLAKMYVDRSDFVHAIEWYERAAEAPSSDPSAHHALLYDLASVLESQGEHARALAVFLELQSEAGDYRDLIPRLEHLTAELKR